MGRMGGRRHLKREVTPAFWPIHRKKFVWALKPSPGPHPIERCIPLGIIVRDLLGFAKTMREAKKIIAQGKILVDGRVRRDEHFPVGLMDVVSIPEIDVNYRVLPYEKGLILHEISGEEAKYKICRIENKTTVNGGHIQLNLHDGRNILIRSEDPSNPAGNIYRTFDTLKISLPDQEILEHLRLEIGMMAIFVDGENIGKYGIIREIDERSSIKRQRNLVTIEDSKGETYQTILDYVFVIGDKTPRISLRGMEETHVVS
ncbi:MAG TPA: 30S ribosomal protein S4e [Candidatus Bathyarchaeota archaeon]|nr:30S ribosomal protein S4e [Candidatus Bathyarchaeota archaeon]